MRADTVRKIVLVAVAVVLIAATLLALAACNPASTVQVPDGGGNTPPSAPENPDTPETPEPEPEPEPDDPVDPDPDTPVDPDPGEEEPETPEMSEEEYRQDNIEALKEILAREYNQFTKTEYSSFNLENIDNIILNPAAGEVYFTADMSGIFGGIIGNFNITGHLGQSFDWQNQEELNKFLTSFNDSESDMTFEESKTTMSSKISEATYNKFVDYVKEQSYDGVDFSAVSDSDIFGVTWFNSDNDAYGYSYIEYKVIDDGKVYTIHAENFMPGSGLGEGAIEAFMKYTNTVFKVVDVQPFKEFDISTVITDGAEQGGGEAEEGGYVLDLSEAPISRAEAASLAFDIWSLNPEKDMDVILPANDSGLEM